MLFFDLDGTLLDSNGIWLDIDAAFRGEHGIAPVPEDYTEMCIRDRVHGVHKGLVAVPQVHRAPHRGLGDDLVGPGAARNLLGLEGEMCIRDRR